MGKLSEALQEDIQAKEASRGWTRLVKSLDDDDRDLLLHLIDNDEFSAYKIVRLLRSAGYSVCWETINDERRRRRRIADAEAEAEEAKATKKPAAKAASKRGRS